MSSTAHMPRESRIAIVVLALTALLEPASAQTSPPERLVRRQERAPAPSAAAPDGRLEVRRELLDRSRIERAATLVRCPTCNQLLPTPRPGLEFLEQQEALRRNPWPSVLEPLATSPLTPSASATFVPAPTEPTVDTDAAPGAATELAPGEQLWEVSLSFEGAMLLPSSAEPEAEVYVKVAAHMGVSSFERLVWKDLTDQDVSTFTEEQFTRMSDVKFVCKVAGDEAVGFSFTFFERDGDYRECATFQRSYTSPSACVHNAGAAQHIWGPTIRFAGPGGVMDFNVAYKLETKRLR